MNGYTTDRFKRLLQRMDGVNARLSELHGVQSEKVRMGGDIRASHASCQLCQAARYAFDGVRQLVFKQAGNPRPGSNQEFHTAGNVGWFSERVDGTAPALGYSCQHYAIDVITAAELLLDQVEAMLIRALEVSRQNF